MTKTFAAAILTMTLLMVLGCTTHTGIKPPNLQSELDAQQNRKTLNGVGVMARPVRAKAELQAYVDSASVRYIISSNGVLKSKCQAVSPGALLP